MLKKVLRALLGMVVMYGLGAVVWVFYRGLITLAPQADPMLALTPLGGLGILAAIAILVAVGIQDEPEGRLMKAGILMVMGIFLLFGYFFYLGVLTVLPVGIWHGTYLDIMGSIVLGYVGWLAWRWDTS